MTQIALDNIFFTQETRFKQTHESSKTCWHLGPTHQQLNARGKLNTLVAVSQGGNAKFSGTNPYI
jgi:hypothetical protein